MRTDVLLLRPSAPGAVRRLAEYRFGHFLGVRQQCGRRTTPPSVPTPVGDRGVPRNHVVSGLQLSRSWCSAEPRQASNHDLNSAILVFRGTGDGRDPLQSDPANQRSVVHDCRDGDGVAAPEPVMKVDEARGRLNAAGSDGRLRRATRARRPLPRVQSCRGMSTGLVGPGRAGRAGAGPPDSGYG